MSSLSAVGRSAAARKNDRVSLCLFTFSDGRRCRTPRIGNHPHFCFYHAQKEARARAAETLGKDLAYFFSGDYLSACDLSAALSRLIPAVVRGDVKPKTARTVAYLAQTLMQAIHISQDEYINAFGTDGWRKSVRNSVNSNHDYLFPPDPEPEQSALSALRTNLRSESLQPQPQPAQPQTQAQQPASSTPPSNPPQPAAAPAVAHPFRGEAFPSASPPQPAAQPIPAPPQTPSPIPTQAPPTLAHASSPTSAQAPQTPAAHPAPSSPACHPVCCEESCLVPAASTTDETHPIPATQFARSVAPAAQPNNPPRIGPSTPQPAPSRDAYVLHFDHNCRLLIDGKPL